MQGPFSVVPASFISYKGEKAYLTFPKEVKELDPSGAYSGPFSPLSGQIELVKAVYQDDPKALFRSHPQNMGYFNSLLIHLVENGHLRPLKYLRSLGYGVINMRSFISLEACIRSYASTGLKRYRDMILYFIGLEEADISSTEQKRILESLLTHGLMDIVKPLLSQFPSVLNWISLSSLENRLKPIKYLVSQGVGIFADSLIYASANGFLDVAKFYIVQGADLHSKDNIAFFQAIIYGQLGMLKYLLEQGGERYPISRLRGLLVNISYPFLVRDGMINATLLKQAFPEIYKFILLEDKQGRERTKAFTRIMYIKGGMKNI